MVSLNSVAVLRPKFTFFREEFLFDHKMVRSPAQTNTKIGIKKFIKEQRMLMTL